MSAFLSTVIRRTDEHRPPLAGMGWLRIEDGKIVEEWTIVDSWGRQRQIGAAFPDGWLGPGWE